MPYNPDKDKFEKTVARDVLPADTDAERTLAQIERFPSVTIFGFLLNPDPKHPLAQVLHDHWSEIHHLTGDKVMITAFDPPAEWSEELKEHWKAKLGDDFARIWGQWQTPRGAGLAFQYLDLFNPPLQPSQLPCLLLYTNPRERTAVVRSIPDWDATSLYPLLEDMLGIVRLTAAEPDPAKRLETLRESLTSPSTIFVAHLGHAKDKTVAFLKANPALLFTTTINFVLALVSGGAISLGAGATAVLKAIRDVFLKPAKA
jgi:hypothetical protein